MRIPFFGAAEARTQIKNYSCRRLRGLISGRGFDSPRLHHFRVSQPISIQARPASESWRALLVLFETSAKTADLKFCRIFQSRDSASRLVQQNRSSCFSLDPELIDRSGLGQTVALHLQVQVTVVLDRVAIGVEQSRVPIAQGLVAFGAVEGQADVAAGDVYLPVK